MPLHGEFNYKQLLPAHAQYYDFAPPTKLQTVDRSEIDSAAECMKLNCVHDLSSQAIVPVLLELVWTPLSQLRSSNL